MSQLKVLARRIASLKTPSDLGKNLAKFNEVIILAANMPAGMEIIEALTVEQIMAIIQPQIDVPSIIPECDCSGNGGGNGSGGGGGDNGGASFTYFEFIGSDLDAHLISFTVLFNGSRVIPVTIKTPDDRIITINVDSSNPQTLNEALEGFYELSGEFDNIITDKIYCVVNPQQNGLFEPVSLSSVVRNGSDVTFTGTCGSRSGVIKIMKDDDNKPIGYIKKPVGDTSFSFTVPLPIGITGSLAIQYDRTTQFGVNANYSV